LIKGENTLVGLISISDDEQVCVIVHREYEDPFDVYDQETIESILGYATILFDTIIMYELITEQ